MDDERQFRYLFSYAESPCFRFYKSRLSSGLQASGVALTIYLPVARQTRRRCELRIYVMLPAALEQERVFVAERLLTEIERRHGLPHPRHREIPPVNVDRFLTAYLPETRDGEPAPLALEYAFSPSLSEALNLMREVVSESPHGCGAALYVHDLDTGITGPH
jgi:hypothetical protein